MIHSIQMTESSQSQKQKSPPKSIKKKSGELCDWSNIPQELVRPMNREMIPSKRKLWKCNNHFLLPFLSFISSVHEYHEVPRRLYSVYSRKKTLLLLFSCPIRSRLPLDCNHPSFEQWIGIENTFRLDRAQIETRSRPGYSVLFNLLFALVFEGILLPIIAQWVLFTLYSLAHLWLSLW